MDFGFKIVPKGGSVYYWMSRGIRMCELRAYSVVRVSRSGPEPKVTYVGAPGA